MNRQLMWIHGLVDRDFNDYLEKLCLEKALSLGLSDRFFRIPLHISLKRSFYTEDYYGIKNSIISFLDNYSVLECSNPLPIIINNRLWLKVENEKLNNIHNELDRYLYDNYSIDIDEFDRNYYPHISLFHNDDSDKLDVIHEILNNNLKQKSFLIDTVAIGTDGNIEKFYLKK